MTNTDLASAGYELCEFGGPCDICKRDFVLGELFWYRTSYFEMEGDYCCRGCAEERIHQAEQEAERWAHYHPPI